MNKFVSVLGLMAVLFLPWLSRLFTNGMESAFSPLSPKKAVFSEAETNHSKSLPANAISLLDTSLEILDWKEGLLNKDALPDLLIVMQPKRMEQPQAGGTPVDKRTLLVLLADSLMNYRIFCENPRIVLCKKCGGPTGDPFAGIQIKGKDFWVKHSGGNDWRWEQYIVFRWNEQKKTFLLQKDETNSFNAANPGAKKKVKTMGQGIVGQTIESFDIYVKR
jgi:hypothetical protein